MSLPLPAAADAASFASFDVPWWAWVALLTTIAGLLVTDLLLVHRTAHVITIKEAAIETGVWVSLGLAFGVLLLVWQGTDVAGEYLAGYVIEESLSVDNVFVWALIFGSFAVPAAYQFRVLFWGIFGALALRGVFIFAGVALIERFDWILYVFGAFLLFTAVRISRESEDEFDAEHSRTLRIVRRIVPSTTEYDGQRLFTKQNGRRLATPLLAVLVLIESTDVVFAVDSIPAILAVTREPFIVFASNAFAMLGLRSLYFCVSGMRARFQHLDAALAIILGFVGLKMLASGLYHVPTWASLAVIISVLTIAIVASLRASSVRRDDGDAEPGSVGPQGGVDVHDGGGSGGGAGGGLDGDR